MKKFSAGDPLELRAADWNRFVDNATHLGKQSVLSHATVGPEFVYVKNTLGRNLARYSAVIIGRPTINTLNDGKIDPCFELCNTSIARQASILGGQEPIVGILPGPIADGRYGVAQIAGITPASFRYDETGNTNVGWWARVSDIDDKLAFSTAGYVRVLPYSLTMGSDSATKYWWVLLNQGATVCDVIFHLGILSNGSPSNFDWSSTPDNNYAKSWIRSGDAVGAGVTTTTGNLLNIAKVGRYFVKASWTASVATTYANAEQLQLEVAWSGGQDSAPEYEYPVGFTPRAFTGDAGTISRRFYGEKCFSMSNGVIPIPGITAKKINAAGSGATGLTASGSYKVHIIRLGALGPESDWPKATADAALARGATAGPL